MSWPIFALGPRKHCYRMYPCTGRKILATYQHTSTILAAPQSLFHLGRFAEIAHSDQEGRTPLTTGDDDDGDDDGLGSLPFGPHSVDLCFDLFRFSRFAGDTNV